MRIAVCPGSFDPVTLGHIDIIRRASKLFDKVIVLISVNYNKKNPSFSIEERVDLIKRCTTDIDNIDIDILEELLSLGELGLQYCIKSKAAYANLREKSDELLVVPYAEFNDRYNQRDVSARNNMRELVDSDANKVTKVFSTLFER